MRLDLKVGFACNNRCLFCVQGDKRVRFAGKPFEELLRILAEGRPRHEGVVFTGGEPTMRPALPRLVARARELGYRQIQIQTNGRLLAYERVVNVLLAAGANEFSPALHGPTAEVHDALTCAPGSFDQTVAGIRHLKVRGARVLTNSVITRANAALLPDLARLLVDLGADQVQFAFVHPVGSAALHFDAVVPRMAEMAPHLLRALDVVVAAGRPTMAEAVPPCVLPGHEALISETRIPATVVVDAEGTIEDYTRYRREEGKLKRAECRGCRHDAVCEGPWREYPERYGWAEFPPVTGASSSQP